MNCQRDGSYRLLLMLRVGNWCHRTLEWWKSGTWHPDEWQKVWAQLCGYLLRCYDLRIDRRIGKEHRKYVQRVATPETPWIGEYYIERAWHALINGRPEPVPSDHPYLSDHVIDSGPYTFAVATEKVLEGRGRWLSEELPCRLLNLVTGQIVMI